MTSAPIPDSYRALIDSPRVSTGTRTALLARAVDDDPDYRPVAMTPVQLETLRAVVRRLVPQPASATIDLAARLDAQLGKGIGDGWRFAILPDDRTAYARGLSALDNGARAEHGNAFSDLTDAMQDAMLTSAAAADLDGEWLQRWFQDLLTDAVKLYMAHPATLARIGYSGIGYGGDGVDKPGFKLVGLGEREAWEPTPTDAPVSRLEPQ